jgi:hypothetical protein
MQAPDIETTQPDRITSKRMGDLISDFEWGYIVEALPRPGRTSFGTRLRGSYSPSGIKHLLDGVFTDLDQIQGHPVSYVWMLETGKLGWTHAHLYLGNISRASAAAVARVFTDNGFGDTLVRRWDRRLETGYRFKTLDRKHSGYDLAEWDFNIIWNRKCRQQMRLNCRWLDKIEPLQRQAPDRRPLAA